MHGFNDSITGNQHSDLTQVIYENDPAGTPSVTYSYDRRGRRSGVNSSLENVTLNYTDNDQPVSEAHTNGPLDGVVVATGYNEKLQRQSLSTIGVTNFSPVTYGYDTAGRLETVTQGDLGAVYQYVANSTPVGQILFTNGTVSMTLTKQYDRQNRLTSIQALGSGAGASGKPVGTGYQYDGDGRRVRAQAPDGTYWLYSYDTLGQVISGKRFWSDGTEILGQQFAYDFDDIGNRLSTGGRTSATSTYSVNGLNQYSTRTVAPYWDVFGIANPTAAVTLNGTAATRQGEYFHRALPVPNSTAQYPAVTVISQFGVTPYTQTNGNVFVPATPQRFYYDADGNLTNDSRWIYGWDAENRLVRMAACNTNPVVGLQQWLAFAYDWQGRRISKKVGAIGSATATNEIRFLYDGWNLIATLNSQLSTLNSFAWGLDLSGSMQGAGGIGGLLWMNNGSASTHFVSYDGNGNVTALVNAADGSESARYEYGPFGELLRATGAMATANPLRYSTKYQDAETDLLYYGFRYHNGTLGRWLNRDPLGEEGFSLLKGSRLQSRQFAELLPEGPNIYSYVGNNSMLYVDDMGANALTWVITIIGPDVAVPDPSDVVLPKWLLYSLVIGGAAAIDYCTTRTYKCEVICPLLRTGGQSNAGDGATSRATATGKTPEEACRKAEREARNAAPPGFRTRHCQWRLR